MSNALALSTVSAAFLRRILSAANAAVPSAKVRLGAPTAKLADDAAALVNLHLYRVEPNTARANEHMPTRGGTGETRGPSKLALNLHYILSFYGDHDLLEPEQLLGAVMLALEHEPVLSRTTVANAIDDNDPLEDSDLDEALARLRVTRQLMTIDDFSKVWSIFYQVPYAVSLTYEVSHVVIETDDPAPVPGAGEPSGSLGRAAFDAAARQRRGGARPVGAAGLGRGAARGRTRPGQAGTDAGG